MKPILLTDNTEKLRGEVREEVLRGKIEIFVLPLSILKSMLRWLRWKEDFV